MHLLALRVSHAKLTGEIRVTRGHKNSGRLLRDGLMCPVPNCLDKFYFLRRRATPHRPAASSKQLAGSGMTWPRISPGPLVCV